MSYKINPDNVKTDPPGLKAQWDDLKTRIREFYPYFLGFYFLSLVISLFSRTWQLFFYWPAMHGSIIFFTLFYAVTINYRKILKAAEFESKFEENRLRVSAKFENFSKGLPKFSQSLFERNRFRVSVKFENFSKGLSKLNHFIEGLASRLIHLVIYCLKFLYLGLLRLIFYIIHLAKHFYGLIIGQGRIYLLVVRNKLKSVTFSSWIKIVIIAAVLILALRLDIGVLEFIILGYGLISVIFILASRWSAIAAAILLGFCPIFLILKKEGLAEITAIYAYYFLIIIVLTQIRGLAMENIKQISIEDE